MSSSMDRSMLSPAAHWLIPKANTQLILFCKSTMSIQPVLSILDEAQLWLALKSVQVKKYPYSVAFNLCMIQSNAKFVI